MDQKIDLIGKKLSGSLTPPEEDVFEKLMEDANFQKLFKKYERIWIGSKDVYSVMNKQSVLNKVLAKIEKGESVSTFSENQTKKGRSKHWILKIAASLLVIISLSFGVYWLLNTPNDGLETSVHSVQITKQNPRGQKSTVFLPDGSIVVLNSESSISYPSVFGEKTREVQLIGEAFFDVEPNTELPFVVKTEDMDIRVLGTSFNVIAHTIGKKHKVSLVTGEVEVIQSSLKTNTNDKIILFPGQAITYDVEDKAFGDIVAFNPKAEYGWKNGLIYFEKASFEDVILKLKSWYGVDFVIDGKPEKEWNYSGEFDNYALSNVLNALSFTGKFKYRIEGKTVSVNF